MAPKFDPEYDKMLSIPVPPADGPRKNAVESLQKQIEIRIEELSRLRRTQNSHAAVSCLPAELLAEAFLCIVESGIESDDSCFSRGTFHFLQVCKHWNEVAVNFPQLWRWWVADAVEAWPLFNFRSKGAPISLTWRPFLLASARDILMDPVIPERIRQLDIVDASEQLAHVLGAFDSSPPSKLSSIRIKMFPYDGSEPGERLARFLSSSFPKLAQLDLENFLPSFPSPILTTGSLTSLRLFLPYRNEKHCYTLSQFSQILRRHPTLQELDLNRGAIPLPGPSTASVPFVPPQLVNLRLWGKESTILGFVDYFGMSSPLHDVTICLGKNSKPTISAFKRTVKKILAAYYECKGLNYARKVYRLAISYNSEMGHLTFDARSRRLIMPNLKSKLRLRSEGVDVLVGEEMVKAAVPLFTLREIRRFSIKGFNVRGGECGGIFQKMKNLLHLQLCRTAIRPVLNLLAPCDRGESDQQIVPRLMSLTLSHLDVSESAEQLLDALEERRDHDVGLRKLVVRSCRGRKAEYESRFCGIVEEVKWDN